MKACVAVGRSMKTIVQAVVVGGVAGGGPWNMELMEASIWSFANIMSIFESNSSPKFCTRSSVTGFDDEDAVEMGG